jgi:hypothetical protein
MASKKPAKPMAGQSKQVMQDPATHGSLILFYGSKDAACVCGKCGKRTVRGMVRMKAEKFYCSATCALAS